MVEMNCSCICRDIAQETIANVPRNYSVWEIGLIIFIVAVVVVILVIGFNKLKDDGDKDEFQHTYY